MTVPTATTATVPSPGLRDTTRSEWTKLRSVRSTWLLLALTAAVGIGLALLFTLAVTATFDTMTAAGRAGFDATGSTRVGLDLSLVLYVVFGAQSAAPEFSSGMMRLTLTVTPNRLRLLAAKAITVALSSYVAGLVFTTVAFLGGQAIIRGADASLALSLNSPGVPGALTNWGMETAAFALIALSLALLLRNAAGAITASLGIIFAPLLVGALVPLWVSRHILAYLPAAAAANLTAPHPDLTSATYLDPQVAGWVLRAWVLAFLALAYLSLTRRDAG